MRGHAHLLADEEHRRFVALPFADHDGAVDRHRVHLVAHRLDGGLVRAVTVALPHRVRAGDGGLLDDAQEVERQVGVQERAVLVASRRTWPFVCVTVRYSTAGSSQRLGLSVR